MPFTFTVHNYRPSCATGLICANVLIIICCEFILQLKKKTTETLRTDLHKD